MVNLKPYDKWLTETQNGIGVSEDCPDDVLQELKGINAEYKEIHGENLLTIDE